jgi:cytochrome c oxidase subunit III
MTANTLTESIRSSAGGNGAAGGCYPDGGGGSLPPRAPQQIYITGMLIALGGIVMFFSAFVSAWVVRRGLPTTDWQPITLPRILWFNTVILAASGASLAYSRRCLARGRETDHRHWWGVTAVLGVLFLAGQLVAWRQMFAAGLFVATSPSSSFFYLFTGAHGLHVLAGVVAFLIVAFRAPRRLTRDTATRVVSLYWHFLGALWLFILLVLWVGA